MKLEAGSGRGAVNSSNGSGDNDRQPNFTRLTRNVGSRRVPIMAFLGVVLSAILSYVFWALITAFGPNAYTWPWVQPVTAIAAISFGVVASVSVLLWAANQSFQREAQHARKQIGGQDQPEIYITGGDSTVNIYTKDWERDQESPSQLVEPDAQESMLTEIYSHGIAQAKLSFFISLIFGTLGSLVLLTGAGLAVWNATSNGQRYAAIVAQVSGAVINLLAGVFFLQSNRTRKDMGAQGVMLRDDSRSDRRLKAAGVLVESISNEELRNQTRAQMALQLVDSNAVVFPASDADGSGADDRTGANNEDRTALPGSQVWGLLLISAACRSKAGGSWPGSVPCR